MEEALSFFRSFEFWIYLLIGLGGLIYVRKFIQAWQELRGAGFGLERESAQGRLNQAATILVLLLMMAMTEFVLVSFIAPTVPGATPLLTPTLNLLATVTITLPPEQPVPVGESGGVVFTTTPTQAAQLSGSGCLSGQVEISTPQNGQEVSGVVEVLGSADLQNFGFYKIEMKRPDETSWLTIQAGNAIVRAGKLGDWDTRRLVPGEYQLSLVIVNNQAQSTPPCMIQVRVSRAPEETPQP
jgi:hypothetical protein